jgi:hypothetical protein
MWMFIVGGRLEMLAVNGMDRLAREQSNQKPTAQQPMALAAWRTGGPANPVANTNHNSHE